VLALSVDTIRPGCLGVIEVGAYADVIIVDCNPLKHISLRVDPENIFEVIMNDGMIYQNALIRKCRMIALPVRQRDTPPLSGFQVPDNTGIRRSYLRYVG
jgi:hypothetical protein